MEGGGIADAADAPKPLEGVGILPLSLPWLVVDGTLNPLLESEGFDVDREISPCGGTPKLPVVDDTSGVTGDSKLGGPSLIVE